MLFFKANFVTAQSISSLATASPNQTSITTASFFSIVNSISQITSIVSPFVTSIHQTSTMIYPEANFTTTSSVICVKINHQYTIRLNMFEWIEQEPINIAKFVCIPYILMKLENYNLNWYAKVNCNGLAYIEGKSVEASQNTTTAIRLALKDFINQAVTLGFISEVDAPNLIC